jgi:hypothetical protein
MGELRNRYHPERHYMRGPGPRWHEKHDGLPARAAEPEHHGTMLALWLVPAVAIALVVAAVALT